MKKLRKRLIVLELLSFAVSVFPLAVTIGINFNKYVKTGSDVVKIGLAGLMAFVFVVMKVLGKLKLPEHRVTTYALVFAFSYLLGAMLDDLVLLSGMALIGEVVDFLLFSYAIKKTREDLFSEKTANCIVEKLMVSEKKEIGRT